MNKTKAIIGYVSATGGTFTMHYRRRASISGISRQGYDNSVFDEAEDATPIVRFDLVKNIADVPLGCPFTNTDYFSPSSMDRRRGNTEDEVLFYRSNGVLVHTYKEYKDVSKL